MKYTQFLAWLVVCFITFSILLNAQTCIEPDSGMVSWWPGNGDGRDIRDNNNGVLHNGAQFAPGYVGQAFSLDGVDDYVQIPYASNLAVTSVTVEAWVKPDVSNKFQRILSNGAAYDLFIDNSGQLRFIVSPQSFGDRESVV